LHAAVGGVPALDSSPGERVFKPARTLDLAMAGLYRARKSSLYEGHGFSRAVQSYIYEGFSP